MWLVYVWMWLDVVFQIVGMQFDQIGCQMCVVVIFGVCGYGVVFGDGGDLVIFDMDLFVYYVVGKDQLGIGQYYVFILFSVVRKVLIVVFIVLELLICVIGRFLGKGLVLCVMWVVICLVFLWFCVDRCLVRILGWVVMWMICSFGRIVVVCVRVWCDRFISMGLFRKVLCGRLQCRLCVCQFSRNWFCVCICVKVLGVMFLKFLFFEFEGWVMICRISCRLGWIVYVVSISVFLFVFDGLIIVICVMFVFWDGSLLC